MLKSPIRAPTLSRDSLWLNLLAAFSLLYLFLVGITCLSAGIKGLGAGVMDTYFTDGMNPILGLLVGILATTLVQSSSVTTSLIVGLVGAGQISVSSAVPMIMGANIGTTVTCTIVSLAHSTQNQEFKRAFAAATCHDFFNFFSVLVLLPLEIATRAWSGQGILERIAYAGAELTVGGQGGAYKSPLKTAFKAGKQVVEGGLESLGFDDKALKIALAVAGGVIILAALTLIVRVMRGVVATRIERYVNRVLGSGGLVAIIVGMVLTVMVQSSSITTSVMVPLAGAGLVTLRQIYPITLGANIGTTVTALLASMAVTDDTAGAGAAMAARQIALVHLSFNLVGMLIWYVPPKLRVIPLWCAEWMAEYGCRSKRGAVTFVLCTFYVVPALIFFLVEAL